MLIAELDYSLGLPPLCSPMGTFTNYLYVVGELEPNYPVPALRTDTLYWRLPQLGIYSKELGYRVTVQTLINAWQLWRN